MTEVESQLQRPEIKGESQQPNNSAGNTGGAASSSTANPTLFTCRACGSEFDKPSALYWHRRKTHSNVRHRCTVCQKTFLQAGGLETHMRIQHAGVRKFECPLCGSAFPNSDLMYRHYRAHEQKQLEDEAAELAAQEEAEHLAAIAARRHQHMSMQRGGYGTSSQQILHAHAQYQTHHGQVLHQVYECQTCAKQFDNIEGMRDHSRKPCGMSSVTGGSKGHVVKASQNNMININNGGGAADMTKPFSCDQCGKCFSTQSGVKRHQKRHYAVHSNNLVSSSPSTGPTTSGGKRGPKNTKLNNIVGGIDTVTASDVACDVVTAVSSDDHQALVVMVDPSTGHVVADDADVDPIVGETVVI